MASTRDLRRRIKSVTNTSKITKAMQMVASSKMRRAQQAALAGRPYAQLMLSILADLGGDVTDLTHPLLEKREVRRTGVLLITSDKGLCGALNSNLLREAARLDRESTVFVCAGRKGAQFIGRTKRNLAADFTYGDNPSFAEARAISKFIQQMFTEGEVDEATVLITRSARRQSPLPCCRSRTCTGSRQVSDRKPSRWRSTGFSTSSSLSPLRRRCWAQCFPTL